MTCVGTRDAVFHMYMSVASKCACALSVKSAFGILFRWKIARQNAPRCDAEQGQGQGHLAIFPGELQSGSMTAHSKGSAS